MTEHFVMPDAMEPETDAQRRMRDEMQKMLSEQFGMRAPLAIAGSIIAEADRFTRSPQDISIFVHSLHDVLTTHRRAMEDSPIGGAKHQAARLVLAGVLTQINRELGTGAARYIALAARLSLDAYLDEGV